MLLIPTNGGLVGAVFPLIGIPDFPKPSLPFNLKPEHIAQIQKMTADQKAQFFGTMMRKKEQAQQQQLLMSQRGAQGGSGFRPASTNMTQNMAATMGMNPFGGGMGVSSEMMQSFMQRNVEGDLGMGS
jgi:hypothetical protein